MKHLWAGRKGNGDHDFDVVVIGAGVSGLSAARDLVDAGNSIVVVEARDRIGGRMWTDRTSMSVAIDLGCEFIHGANASTWELVHHLGLKTLFHDIAEEEPGSPRQRTNQADLPPEYQNFRVVGGYDQILVPIADELPIQLDTVVRRVEHSSAGVVVHADQRGRAVTYRARSAVVTLPVAVLAAGDVEFSPALPAEKVDAFAAVPQVPITKVLMEFDHPVIPADADDMVEAGVPWYVWNASKEVPGFSGQVVGMGAEMDEATRLLALPRERRHADFLDVLRGIAGDPRLEPVTVVEHEWAKDPFARAAFTDSDSVADDVEMVYEPDGDTLYWAGLITDQVDLSHDSGRETASELLKRLG